MITIKCEICQQTKDVDIFQAKTHEAATIYFNEVLRDLIDHKVEAIENTSGIVRQRENCTGAWNVCSLKKDN